MGEIDEESRLNSSYYVSHAEGLRWLLLIERGDLRVYERSVTMFANI